jgi:hypothetical protein
VVGEREGGRHRLQKSEDRKSDHVQARKSRERNRSAAA